MNLSVIWPVAMTELSLNRRLFRTWMFIIFSVILVIVSLFGVMVNYAQFSTTSSSAFLYSPLMQMLQSFSSMIGILSLATLFLAMEVHTRDKRERIAEVFGTLPVSNLELVVGRALGVSLLLYVAIVVSLILLYLLGVIFSFALPELGYRPPETWSFLAAILIDAFPNLLMWASLTVFFAMLLRYRILVVCVVVGIFGLITWLQTNSPIYISQLMNTLSAGFVLPSEVAPDFTSVQIIVQRIAMLLFSGAMLCWAALLSPRVESQKSRLQPAAIALLLTVLAIGGFYGSSAVFTGQINERTDFIAVHQAVPEEHAIDILSLKGNVDLDPGDTVSIDMSVVFKARGTDQIEDNLYFSLNPAYNIESLKLNHEETAFSFEEGLLSIPLDRPISSSTSATLAIQAEGNPNPRFAYLDSVIDLWSGRILEAIGLFYQGSEAAINHNEYVALLPAVAWYPLPGSHLNRENKWVRERDFFDISLNITVPNDWHVASVGRPQESQSGDFRQIQFQPSQPVHEVGVFGAEFERFSDEIEDVEFELLVAKQHTKNVELFGVVQDEVRDRVTEMLQRSRELGLSYPYDTFTIVEVPTYLRSYRGGWRMDAVQSLPGVFLLREGTFLEGAFTESVNRILEGQEGSEEDKKESIFYLLMNYFRNDTFGGNVIHAFADNLLQYQTDVSGPGAIPLSYVLDYLTKILVTEQESFYSIHVNLGSDSFASSAIGMSNISNEGLEQSLNDFFYERNINQPAVWDFLLEKPLGEFDYSDETQAKQNLHVLLLAGRAMARQLSDSLEDEQAGKLLAGLLARYRGQTFTLEELLALSDELNVPTRERLDNWLTEISVPGFQTSNADIVRLPDLEYGVARYETSFQIRNAEPAAGLFNVGYTEGSANNRDVELRWMDPIQVDGDTSMQISLVAENPIETIMIEPYFSLNRSSFSVEVNVARNYPEVDRDANPLIQFVDWQPQIEGAIIVDDLHSGFAVSDSGDASQNVPFPMQYIGMWLPEPDMDSGLLIHNPIGFPVFGQWSRQEIDSAFGDYRRTTARVQANSTDSTANFTVNLPRSGEWALDYHLPNPSESVSGGGFGGVQVRIRTERRGPSYGNYKFLLTSGDQEIPVEFSGDDAEPGWNRLGQFNLKERSATVSLFPESNESVVYADAIRWVPNQ